MFSENIHMPRAQRAQRLLSRRPAGTSGKSGTIAESPISSRGISPTPDRGSSTKPTALRADAWALRPAS
eukprot:2568670-Pyramimonas_sp.AAC.1